MEMKQPQGPICQSCSMPMQKPVDFGTNADGTKNQDYCTYCFQKGKFTEPNITLGQMIDKCADIMAMRMKIPEAQAKTQMKSLIPRLKRWLK